MATFIDGVKAAAEVTDRVRRGSQRLEAEKRLRPSLAVVIVGDDPASHAYVGAKGRKAEECGFDSIQHTLPHETTQQALALLVSTLNDDPGVHGILVQLPLPGHLDAEPIIQSISPEKDVDGLNAVNAGKLATGDFATGLISCTPAGAMLLVKKVHGPDLSGRNAVVIGRSNLFGKPMAALLLAANATVTVAHSRTTDLPSVCRTADILVAAVGRAAMVKADWVKPGATVIDVGINRIERQDAKPRLVGDVDFAACAEVAGAITPVPGGVGPMTIAMLMANTLTAACRQCGISAPEF
jgi:methylenetetrahydrofolate dehydrogenase (NADP+)/methenyltetrahydrofolate cyclohydrolase